MDLSIDPESLDTECVRQVDLFMKWCERSIEARAAVEDAKILLDTKTSEVDLRIRRRPEKYGLDKVTDPGIKATVLTHPDYLRAMKTYHEARDTAAYLEKAVLAMEMKKRMLDNLITLHGQQYFAGPATPRDLGNVWKRQQEEREKRLTERQTLRVRAKRKKKG
jgi:hypothetical protein